MHLFEVSFVILDTETTGLNPAFGDRIIEIALLKVRNREIIDRFESLINPGRFISPGASAINGITDEMVRYSPYFTQIADPILAFIEDSVLVIHNAKFDLGFLAAQLKLAKRPNPVNPVIDTIRLAKQIYPNLESYGLGNLATALEIIPENLHRAMDDVEITSQVFNKILTALDSRNIKSIDELLILQGGSILFPEVADIPLPEELEEAIQHKTKLTITYISSSGTETIRTIEPIEVNILSDYIYLVAFCELRGDKRTFRLDRIIGMKKDTG
jgi:DNA polymerase III epsilon subunit family exonuclease